MHPEQGQNNANSIPNRFILEQSNFQLKLLFRTDLREFIPCDFPGGKARGPVACMENVLMRCMQHDAPPTIHPTNPFLASVGRLPHTRVALILSAPSKMQTRCYPSLTCSELVQRTRWRSEPTFVESFECDSTRLNIWKCMCRILHTRSGWDGWIDH